MGRAPSNRPSNRSPRAPDRTFAHGAGIEVLEPRVHLSARLVHSTTNLPDAREPYAAAAAGTKILFAGVSGFLDDITSAVDIYDTRTGGWSSAQLSQPRWAAGTASTGETAFFAGGYTAAGAPSNAVDVYNARTGHWSAARPLPHPRSEPAGAAVGNQVIFAGGTSDPAVAAYADVYDVVTGRWSTSRLPLPSYDKRAVVVGKLAIFNGSDGGINLYDGETGRWWAAVVPDGVYPAPLTRAGTKTFFPTMDGAVAMYDVLGGNWSRAALSLPRFDTVSTTLGTKAIFAGGIRSHPLSGAPIFQDAVDVYDAATDTWSTAAAPLSAARAGLAGTAAGTRALFATGSGTDVDVFTDATPAADLRGCLGAAGRDAAPVSVHNSGNAALAPFTVSVYGARAGRRSVLLGTVAAAKSLRPGASRELSVPLAFPRGTSAGDFRLVAAAGPAGGRQTVFAAQLDLTPPSAALLPAERLAVARAAYVFTVSYHDDRRVDAGTPGDDDVLVTGPNGFARQARVVSNVRGKHGSTRVVTYAIDGPGRRWDASDNGEYALHLRPLAVTDRAGNAADAGVLGAFHVAVAAPHAPPATGAAGTASVVFQSRRHIDEVWGGMTGRALG